MSMDRKAPELLRQLQEGFARSIRQPLALAPQGYRCRTEEYDDFAVGSVVERPHLSGLESLSIYNEQYWFRLLGLLQEEMPLMCRVLGVQEFNHFASLYLSCYPSRNPEVQEILADLPQWMTEDHAWSTPKLQEAARLDYLYQRIFFTSQQQALSAKVLEPQQIQHILHQPLPFQSSFHLFTENWNCMEQAQIARQQADPEGDKLTLRPQCGWWSLYRDAYGLAAEPLSALQFRLLQRLLDGEPLTIACSTVEQQSTEAEKAELYAHIQGWFFQWNQLAWFCVPESSA